VGCYDLHWAGPKMKNNIGQTTIEYLFLTLVVVLIAYMILKHPRWQELVGADGSFRQAMMNYVQASYRHGYVPANDNRNYDRGHQSYVNVEGEGDSVTRFFAPLDPDE